VLIEARATGRQLPLVPDHELPTDGWGVQTLRELIERVVREEVAAFGERERSFLHVLTELDLEQGIGNGRIVSGVQAPGARMDADVAVMVAVQAFEDRLYLVLIDGKQQRRLDAQVQIADDSTLTFLRLFPGG
jgi:hypothetical protein